MADDAKEYKYASVDPNATDPVTPAGEQPLTWQESDGSKHAGTEYTFPPESGLPHLRTEWVPRTDGASYGLGILFMATVDPSTGGGPSDYSFADSADHPDNEQHYRDTLFDFGELFPTGEPATREDGSTVTVDDAVQEAVRRYRGWLRNIHPDPTQQLIDAVSQQSSDLIAACQAHAELLDQLTQVAPDVQVPQEATDAFAAVAALDPAAVAPVIVTPDPTPVTEPPIAEPPVEVPQ